MALNGNSPDHSEVKVDATIKKPKATWVEPQLYADIGYRGSQVGAGQFVQGLTSL
jgi:hypothetical protein